MATKQMRVASATEQRQQQRRVVQPRTPACVTLCGPRASATRPFPPERVPSLARSYGLRPLGRTELVKAEFVLSDAASLHAKTVSLHGDWDAWEGKAMREEERGLWSVVCVVPTGRRAFGFTIDGVWHVSARHPVEDDGRVNWRVVLGPAQRKAQVRSPFYHWAREWLGGFGIVALQDQVGELPGLAPRRHSMIEAVVRKDWASVVVTMAALYLFGAALYGLVFTP